MPTSKPRITAARRPPCPKIGRAPHAEVRSRGYIFRFEHPTGTPFLFFLRDIAMLDHTTVAMASHRIPSGGIAFYVGGMSALAEGGLDRRRHIRPLQLIRFGDFPYQSTRSSRIRIRHCPRPFCAVAL